MSVFDFLFGYHKRKVGSTKTTPSITANKPVTESSGNDEIYIDLLESLTFLFAANVRNNFNNLTKLF
jgi:hypothetical protein